MRVAIVIRKLDPRRGGAEVWTAQLVERLARDGHRVLVVSEEMNLPPGERVEFVRIRLSSRLADRRRIEFAERAESVLRQLQPDITHDQGDGWYADLFQPHGGTRAGSMARNLLRLPAWARPIKRAAHHLLPRYRALRKLQQKQYTQPGTVYVAVSELVARELTAHYGIARDRIRVVPNGVDTTRFRPGACARHGVQIRNRLAAGPRTTVFCFVATNFSLKGGPPLLRAFHALRRSGADVRLIIVGRGPTVAQRWLYWRRGWLEGVWLAGSVQDPRPFYAAADTYIHPTFGDACSLVVLEAMAMGLPVITTRANGAAELVERFEAGEVVPSAADQIALQQAMRRACDWEWRFAHAAAARAARPWLDWEHNYRRIVALYREHQARWQRLAG